MVGTPVLQSHAQVTPMHFIRTLRYFLTTKNSFRNCCSFWNPKQCNRIRLMCQACVINIQGVFFTSGILLFFRAVYMAIFCAHTNSMAPNKKFHISLCSIRKRAIQKDNGIWNIYSRAAQGSLFLGLHIQSFLLDTQKFMEAVKDHEHIQISYLCLYVFSVLGQ